MKQLFVNISAVCACICLACSCEDMFDPAIENNRGVEYMYENAAYAEGILANAYSRIPCDNYTFSEVATDDAVSNDAGNSFRRITSGAWTSDFDPLSQWVGCRAAIMYINLFLANADRVHWADDEIVAKMFLDREKGEAYGLRAMYNYYLLQAHAGRDADGTLLGFPIVTTVEDAENVVSQQRNTFEECVTAIYDDCARALELLPMEYANVTADSDVPAKYMETGAKASQYNRVFGDNFRGRMSGKTVQAFRAKTALLAASPAFGTVGWQEAADRAAELLDPIGGTAGMDTRGWRWFSNASQIDGLVDGKSPAEILWRGERRGQSNDWEKDNYPPSIYGNGRVNPTQNFVDAFPMANGYPIGDSESGYDAANPYQGRDPRLTAYVLVNGGTAGVNNTTVITASDGADQDALDRLSGRSTRTGYYLKKLLRQDINLDPVINSKQYHYVPRIRFTEMFLNYAEAANEAFGPTGTGEHGYSAYDVVRALRKRAGVGGKSDPYLESIKGDQDKMRQLIRNERRIELSFEGFRFWDLRRWQCGLNETAQGVNISQANGTYSVFDVETRNYKDYQTYGPIPYSEVLKFSELKQNKGW